MSAGTPTAQGARASCFVTGTDTGVGKTLVASALVCALGQRGLRVVGMKPVASGALWRDGAWRNEDVEQLAAAANVTMGRDLICPYLLAPALAPHLAAELSGVRIELPTILRAYEALSAKSDAVIVEGVGGFRVPLGQTFDTADLARELQLPIVLVVGLRLGCLNHAALTAEAIAARGLHLAGWVANTVDPHMDEIARNVETLRALLPAAFLGFLPRLNPADGRCAAERLDVGGFLPRGL